MYSLLFVQFTMGLGKTWTNERPSE